MWFVKGLYSVVSPPAGAYYATTFSVCFLSARMNEMGLSPTENKVYFGQLLGMCDQISFPLGMLTLCTAAITDSYIRTSCVCF